MAAETADKEELVLTIETAIQEATICLNQGVEPERAMWTLPTEKLQIFSYTVSTPDLQTLYRSWVYYKNNY